ncbi:uncharacterized protein [Choristoneura fumiferana]|uniref:uncharacterized protein n=1 Tax=Choristoneura fumiferana TaxID=7141 RepID=UPI003D15D8F6
MDFLFVVALALQIAAIASKKYDSSSDESSIENILYYKDCSHKAKQAPIEQLRAVVSPPKPQTECVPKMCCSMSCANNCGQDANQGGNQFLQSQSMPMMQPFQPPPRQPLPLNQRPKKNKQQKPIGGRRSMGMGFTREHIKTLISQDEDIKKILKDLVRVTMQKVDLIDMINARRNANKIAQAPSSGRVFSINHSEEDDDEADM